MHVSSSAASTAAAGSAQPDSSVERFPLVAARDRWLDFLPLEHETLPLPIRFEREGDCLLVFRRPLPGRPIREGRVPVEFVGALLLQAAAALAFFRSHGFWLDDEDLALAHWDRQGGSARLWLTRSPASLSRGGAPPGACAVLEQLLDRLARRGGRISTAQARALADRLAGAEAPLRRAEFGVAAVFRSFPSLAGAPAARARRRTVGSAGTFLRDARSRAVADSARAILENRRPRLFLQADSLAETLGLDPPPSGSSQASRRLRDLARSDAACGGAAWIVAGLERWDALSRRAFESAARSLPAEIELRPVADAPPPRLPDEWRREIFVPCGSMAASLRFYEWLADEVREQPEAARDAALDCLGGEDWAAFASDPTGQAPLPARRFARLRPEPEALGKSEREVLTLLASRGSPSSAAEIARFCGRRSRAVLENLLEAGLVEELPSGWRVTAAGRRGAAEGTEAAALWRRWAGRETAPARRIDLLLRAGAAAEALDVMEAWYRAAAAGLAERWFELSARLSAAVASRPPWLESIEAEREAAGGRPAEARAILGRIAADSSAPPEDRRAAQLREAELCARTEDASEAGRRAARWSAEFPEAPSAEMVRALRLEAAGLAREGRHDAALERLDAADRLAADLDEPAKMENALSRASVLSLAGRFSEEAQIYDRWRPKALEGADDALAARLLSQEALGLSDRRQFREAAARLEEALAVLRDDPAERCRVVIDLAATLYHAGRPSRCSALLEEAAVLAASAGRRDLLRIARSNRIELWVAAAQWDPALAAIEQMVEDARGRADELWLLVALHHRGRVALRRGFLEAAAEDNERARRIAERLGDRLEIGELWLEEGDRCLYERDFDGARRAWQQAACDLPDRCGTETLGRDRLRELCWRNAGGPSPAEKEQVVSRLALGDYGAAETAARWRVLLGEPGAEDGIEIEKRAALLLREQGGGVLADRIFGRGEEVAGSGSIPADTLRLLREGLARGIAGEDSSEIFERLGVGGLCLSEESGREILRLGHLAPGQAATRRLEAGAASYRLALPRETPEPLASSAALLAETLLFRPPVPAPREGFVQGWRRFGIVTEDSSMEEPYRRLTRFAAQPVTVLARGESGSGKEAVARAVHALSPRSAGPFVAVNVPAIPAALLESELFGHVRGAFTGADRERVGLLEEAARGTIFFDEIGDLAPELQSKLLRALQDREIRRLGENRSRRIDVRVVSATSRDLAREVAAGRFREDLYYRLHVAVIALPPLRERGRDTLKLARHFLESFGREYSRGALRLSPEASRALSAHPWPGNVRELQNAMAQAAALADSDGVVGLAHLPETLRAQGPRSPITSYRSRLDAHRKGMISDALDRAGGNRSLAARELGLSRQALRYLMKELKVASARERGPA